MSVASEMLFSVTTSLLEPRVAHLDTRGPYDLREVALMGFGHRDEREFDGVMRMAFCVDGDYEQQVGVEVRQSGNELEVRVHDRPGQQSDLDVVAAQVARVLSVNHDGFAFARLCQADPALRPLHDAVPGFRPALFYSPYEAAVWSILSARRARPQGIGLRSRLSHTHGVTFDLAGVDTPALPTPSALMAINGFPGLPADRIPRLRAIAEAAQQGRLSVERLTAMSADEAKADLQQLPGVGPFYSALIVIRACGLADVLSLEESRSREAVRALYGIDHELTDAELAEIAERWRPFRTWVTVMVRAISGRIEVSMPTA
jgi:DNA-3-methyladenine glycosylase II